MWTNKITGLSVNIGGDSDEARKRRRVVKVSIKDLPMLHCLRSSIGKESRLKKKRKKLNFFVNENREQMEMKNHFEASVSAESVTVTDKEM